jgi:DNA-directed RNA polymerase specialized sigma24 family protein
MEAAEALKVPYHDLVTFESFTKSPLRRNGQDWKRSALRVADALFSDPEDLWPAESRHVGRVRASFEATAEQLREAGLSAEKRMILLDDGNILQEAMKALAPRTRKILMARVVDGLELGEVGRTHGGLSRERVRQIVARAERELGDVMRKMMTPVAKAKAVAPLTPVKPEMATCEVCRSDIGIQSDVDWRAVRRYACFQHRSILPNGGKFWSGGWR